MQKGSLFDAVLCEEGGEAVAALVANPHAKIHRIVSRNYQSPQGFWYDQDDDEWVMVVRGDATLEFADGESIDLHSGDYLTIPRHVRHRIARTSGETIWLAVYLK